MIKDTYPEVQLMRTVFVNMCEIFSKTTVTEAGYDVFEIEHKQTF
jgi:hypothetical protein